jgi:hypothetical protein
MNLVELHHRFVHHPPRDSHVAELHSELRRRCLELADWLNISLPSSDEAKKAIDLLDDVCMHGNAAVARYSNYLPGPQ